MPPSILGLPLWSHSPAIQPNAAVAAAKCVAMKALVASADAASALPAENVGAGMTIVAPCVTQAMLPSTMPKQ